MQQSALNRLRDALLPYPQGAADSALLSAYLSFYNLTFPASNEYHSGFVNSGEYQLMTQLWLQPNAVANLLLVHGYYDHTGIYDKVIDYATSRRCNVLIFDLPGHGLSTGERAVIGDFSDYGDAIAAVLNAVELPDLPLFAMGQSTGCAALTEFARRYEWPFQQAAMLAPLVRPAGWRGVQLARTLLSPFVETLNRKFNSNSSDLDFLAFVRRDPLQYRRVSLDWLGALQRWLADLPLEDLGVGPVFVIQGRRDGTVDWRYNMGAIQKLYPGSRIAYLDEAGHQLANESVAIRAEYEAQLDAYFQLEPLQ
ncbi:alpha/beta fold hydrolase [Halioglobus maricola]|uniref:Alpha/beta fold hydrolase n=1 Tax=Halioglobus maricola TaxID=2601894 RepID=A0A5P9NPJ6_9GAMM|nr:alpha/beta hydrolase [Halioglobus maricola]QFU77589.1 alpha/beta fold hydrolase [Halioglobus maricola]